ncbi:hypothetical protein ZOSMA_303G00030 [Zostera marina]|uniref:DUF868 family protein n=1 Tax=Zostera marina TaxID=29655 RepID=A0A0K9PCL4_ZOSMR|nr:hypothetical protein ZOSMA_303G00030 [Zostera marina]
MRDFPSCFSENGVQISETTHGSSRNGQNMSACVYQIHMGRGESRMITITWSKNMMGQGFMIEIEDGTKHCLSKVEIKPWLFSKRKGSKNLDVEEATKVDIFWDLSTAKIGPGPEPLKSYYVAVVFDMKMVLLVGDMRKEAYKKTGARPPHSNATYIGKREHVSGKKVYSTRTQFCNNGRIHDISIECDTVRIKDPYLEICIDKKRVMLVKSLAWKFRGNQTILVDGFPLEVFWDVHSWLFGSPITTNAVFMFQSYAHVDKSFPWSSCSSSFRESQLQALGFSLVLYACKE